MVFAELADRGDLWRQALEDWGVEESKSSAGIGITKGSQRRAVLASLAAVLLVSLVGCRGDQEARERARTQVKRWAERLDAQTTETGVYIRHQGEQLPEQDPWGTPLRVMYSQGGMAETLTVCSAGPDREFDTDDDISMTRMTMNLKGVGEGVRQNVEEVSEKAAAGAGRGAVRGIREGIREALPKKKDGSEETQDTDQNETD
jgi:hypothetical protein